MRKVGNSIFRITYSQYGVGSDEGKKRKYPSYLRKGKKNKSAKGW